MTANTSITSLSKLKARNLIRGLISNTDPGHTMRALEKIRIQCSEADFKQALLVLRGNDIFEKNAIGRDFNSKFPSLIGKGATTKFSSEDIIKRINDNKNKIIELLNIIGDILQKIAISDYSSAIENCKLLIENNGSSVAVLRYLQFVRNHCFADQDKIRKIEETLSATSIENMRYITTVMRELSSPRTDYFNISDRILKADWTVSGSISRTFLDIIPRSPDDFLSSFSSLYCVSLIDAFLYISRLQKLSLSFVPELSADLIMAYSITNKKIENLNDLYDTSDDGFGLDLFKESFLLIEFDEVFQYRTVHAALFNTIERKEDRRTNYERDNLKKYFNSIDSIGDIGTEKTLPKLCLDKYESNDACHFQNSTALIYLLERSDGDIKGSEHNFVKVMSRTRYIGNICPQQYIESIKNNAKLPELKIVASSLAHIKKRTQLNEHELRSVLQYAATSKFDSNYTKLLEHIFDISPAVAEHLINTSDETFLSKLFQIMSNPNAAIEERANLLEWYGVRNGDPSFIDRARNLRIDVQISKERGTIDDSRIYVDPVKFTQWISNHVLDRFALLLDSLPQPVEPILVPLAWDKVKTGIDVYEQLASLILECYEEFCSNKVYGIAAYLGRRIRHGTLKGTGFNDIVAFDKQARFSQLFESSEFSKAYSNWIENYALVFDELRDKYLYIQNKNKPDGLILLDFRSTPKKTAATHLLHDILKSFSVNLSCAEIPYLILEYCWRIVEEDLSSIRKLVMEKKSQFGVFRAYHAYTQNCRQRDLQDFCQELNSLAAERFRTIELWFNKPSIASPSADITLLFKAVVSEVRSQFLSYKPEVIVDEHGFMLNGGAYHVIYDALFILIYNAAENGDPTGVLKMQLELQDNSGKMQVKISIFSQISPLEEMNQVIHSINSALKEDCEDAMVVEGRSGIKKLRRMEQDGYIHNVNYAFDQKTVAASFSYALDY